MGRKIGTFGLVNYRRHPKNPNYIVFGFNSEKEADIFEAELKKSKTRYEKDTEQAKTGMVYLFAVSEGSMDEATAANGKVRVAVRDPLLKNKLIRFSLLAFVGALIILAVVGYVKNSEKRTDQHKQNSTDTTNLQH